MFKITSICNGGGYKYCRTEPKHPKANSKGLYPLHRVLVEIKLGRLLLENEDVHHINEDKEDNRIENLQVFTKSEHAKLHNPDMPLVTVSCGNCGKSFSLKQHRLKLRLRKNKSNTVYCSKSCGSIATQRQ